MQADASETKRRKRVEKELSEVDYAPSAKTIERIEHLHADGLPIVSAYLPVRPGPEGRKLLRSETDSLLHQIRPLADDRNLEHAARLSLRDDMGRIADLVEQGSFKAGTLAIFSCSGAGKFEVIGLPRAVRARITVDEIAATRPLLAVLDEYHRCCAVVVDRETAHAWELYLGEALDTGALPSAGRRGVGQDVNERRDDQQGGGAREAPLPRGGRRARGAVSNPRIRGPGRRVATKTSCRASCRSSQGLCETASLGRSRSTTTASGPPPHAEQAEAILQRYELDEHRRGVAEVLETAAAGGPAAVGLESCLWAASVRAVQDLYTQEGASSPGVVCDESRWLGLRGETLSACGGETRARRDVIEELVEAVVDESGSIHHVPADAGLAGSSWPRRCVSSYRRCRTRSPAATWARWLDRRAPRPSSTGVGS